MKTKINASLIALAIAALPLTVQAAGLGRITVFSALGQPLSAEIEISATPEELSSLSARIAGQDAFASSNIAYSPALGAVRVEVGKRNDKSVVRLMSDRPFSEPFVDVLIELGWASGRVVREYTFLLDPPDLQPAKPSRPVRAALADTPKAGATSAPVPAQVAAAPAPAGAHAGSDAYEVKRGDTLRRIAEANRPAGVSLDQMLVAIYRQNPDAFDGKNMNRLKTGKILTLPGANEVAAVPAAEARREVQVHSNDFNTYRARMAAGAAAAVPRDAGGDQSSGGRITPKMDEGAHAGTKRDEVKVSRTEVVKPGQATSDGIDPKARLRALEEDLAARDKSIEEANARLKDLEETVRQMQRLLELRNQALATAQAQAAGQQMAAAAPTPAKAPEPAPAKAVEAAPAKPVEPQPAPASTPSPASTPAPVAEAPKPPAPPAVPDADKIPEKKVPVQSAPSPLDEPEPGLVDSLLKDPMLLAGGGGVLLLLLGYLGLKMRKREPKPEKVAPAVGADAAEHSEMHVVHSGTGGATVDTGEPSVLNTDFGRGTLSAIDADEGVDPVAEADVYIAYGRDAQAEEILLDALKSGTERTAIHVKLLEIYAQRRSMKQFETIASDLYARTGGQGEDWEKAAVLGRKLDPDNPLFAVTGSVTVAAAAAAVATAAAAVAPAPAPAAAPASAADEGLTFDFDLPDGDGEGPDHSASVAPTVAPAFDEGLSFDLPAFDATVPEKTEPAPAPVNDDDMGLEFSLPGIDATPAPAPADEDLSFDLPDVGGDTEVMAATSLDMMPSFDFPSDSIGPSTEIEMTDTVVRPYKLDANGNLIEEPEGDEGAASAGEAALDFELDIGEPAAGKAEADGLDFGGAVPGAVEAHPDEMFVETSLETSLDFSPPGGGDMEGGAEAETKLELARAYEEMGDKEGARELLGEVLAEGTPAQQDTARQMLAKLG